MLIGPILGGLLPGRVIPRLGYAPAFWPAMVTLCFSLLLFVMAYFILPETRVSRDRVVVEGGEEKAETVTGPSVNDVQWARVFLLMTPCFTQQIMRKSTSVSRPNFFQRTYHLFSNSRLEFIGISSYIVICFVMYASDVLIPLCVESSPVDGGMGLPKSFTAHFLLVYVLSSSVQTQYG